MLSSNHVGELTVGPKGLQTRDRPDEYVREPLLVNEKVNVVVELIPVLLVDIKFENCAVDIARVGGV